MKTYSSNFYSKMDDLKNEFDQRFPDQLYEWVETDKTIELSIFHCFKFVKQKKDLSVNFYINGKKSAVPSYLSVRNDCELTGIGRFFARSNRIESLLHATIQHNNFDLSPFSNIIIFNHRRKLDLYQGEYQGIKKELHTSVISQEPTGTCYFRKNRDIYSWNLTRYYFNNSYQLGLLFHEKFIRFYDQDHQETIQSVSDCLFKYRLPTLLRIFLFDDKKEPFTLYNKIRDQIRYFFDKESFLHMIRLCRGINAGAYYENSLTQQNIQNHMNSTIFKEFIHLTPLLMVSDSTYALKVSNRQIRTYAQLKKYLTLSNKEMTFVNQLSFKVIQHAICCAQHQSYYTSKLKVRVELIKLFFYYVKHPNEFTPQQLLTVFEVILVIDRQEEISALVKKRLSYLSVDYMRHNKDRLAKKTKNAMISEIQEVLDFVMSEGILIQKNQNWLSLSNASQAWHQAILERNQFITDNYQRLKWSPVLTQTIKNDHFHAKELCSSKELLNESKRMQHCISSYIRRCYAGNYFVFHLTDLKTGEDATLGIAVDRNQGLRFDQVRGIRNQEPSSHLVRFSEQIFHSTIRSIDRASYR